jgi:glycerol-3-phosphate cytidylyltransferase
MRYAEAKRFNMNDYLDFDGLVVYTGGTFDLFHAGHVNFLKRCKEIAGELGSVVVSLNTDEFIKEYKGKPPIVSFSDRMAVLKACKYVDQVIANSGGADSKPTILQVNPNIVAIGSDWAKKDYYKQMQFTQDWLDDKDISLIYIPYTKGISSTEIKTRL